MFFFLSQLIIRVVFTGFFLQIYKDKGKKEKLLKEKIKHR